MSRQATWKSLVFPIFICSLASLFYLYDFVLRVIPSIMATDLMAQYHVDAVGFGVLSSYFFIGYTIMQVPCGLLYDRYGPRRLLTINCLLAATASLLFISTNSFLIASIARLFMGVGSAFAYIGALMLVMRWLPKHFYATTVGIIQLMGATGAVIGQAALAFWISHSTPSRVMTHVAVIGFILAFLFFIFIRDYPASMKHKLKRHFHANILRRLKRVLNRPQNWFTALYAFAIWAPISVFAALWDVPFLQEVDHISATSAAALASSVWVGIGIGGPALGWLSEHLHSRRTPLLIAALLGVVASSFIIFTPKQPHYIEVLLLLLFGVAGSAQAVTFGVISDNNAPRRGGTAAGFNNMAIVLGGAMMQPLVGLMIRWHSHGAADKPIHYVTSDYQFALTILPICFAVAFLVALFFIRETKCTPQYQ